MVQPLLDEAQVGQDSFQLQQQCKHVEQGSLDNHALQHCNQLNNDHHVSPG